MDKKFGQGPPPPHLDKIQKNSYFFFVKPSFMSTVANKGKVGHLVALAVRVKEGEDARGCRLSPLHSRPHQTLKNCLRKNPKSEVSSDLLVCRSGGLALSGLLRAPRHQQLQLKSQRGFLFLQRHPLFNNPTVYKKF